MSYGKFINDETLYTLKNSIITIEEKKHPERFTEIHFKNKKYADDYFVNDLKGEISKIIKTWSYYIKYFKVQTGNKIEYYCVDKDDKREYQVYEVQCVNEEWKIINQLNEDDPISLLVMKEFEKQEADEKEIRMNKYREERIIEKEDPKEELERLLNEEAERLWWGNDYDDDDD